MLGKGAYKARDTEIVTTEKRSSDRQKIEGKFLPFGGRVALIQACAGTDQAEAHLSLCTKIGNQSINQSFNKHVVK